MLHLPQMARVERRLGAREGEPHQYVE
jgi:hypothetical protein